MLCCLAGAKVVTFIEIAKLFPVFFDCSCDFFTKWKDDAPKKGAPMACLEPERAVAAAVWHAKTSERPATPRGDAGLSHCLT